MKKSDKKHIFGLLALLILLMSFFLFYFSTQKNKSAERYRKSENEQIYLTKKIKHRKAYLNKFAFQQALSSPNLKVRKNIIQMQAASQAEKAAKRLFPILLNYNNSDEYNKRAALAQNLVTKNVICNKSLFGSDYIQGSHYVDSSELKSQYRGLKFASGVINGTNLPFLVNVTFISWFFGQNKAVTDDIYIGTYSYAKKKITGLRRLNNLYQSNLNTTLLE